MKNILVLFGLFIFSFPLWAALEIKNIHFRNDECADTFQEDPSRTLDFDFEGGIIYSHWICNGVLEIRFVDLDESTQTLITIPAQFEHIRAGAVLYAGAENTIIRLKNFQGHAIKELFSIYQGQENGGAFIGQLIFSYQKNFQEIVTFNPKVGAGFGVDFSATMSILKPYEYKGRSPYAVLTKMDLFEHTIAPDKVVPLKTIENMKLF